MDQQVAGDAVAREAYVLAQADAGEVLTAGLRELLEALQECIARGIVGGLVCVQQRSQRCRADQPVVERGETPGL